MQIQMRRRKCSISSGSLKVIGANSVDPGQEQSDLHVSPYHLPICKKVHVCLKSLPEDMNR